MLETLSNKYRNGIARAHGKSSRLPVRNRYINGIRPFPAGVGYGIVYFKVFFIKLRPRLYRSGGVFKISAESKLNADN